MISETLAAGVRVYVASIPVKLMLGDQLLGFGTGDPIFGAILLFVGLSLLYTYIGGVKAVIWTDAVQFVLFLLGGAFALFYIPTLVDGGLNAVVSQAAAGGKLHWLNYAPQGPRMKFLFGAPFNIWMGVIGGTVLVMSSHGAEQLIVQRVLACKSVADGRKALVLSAAVIFPLFLIFLLVGVMLWVFYQGHPFQIPLPEPRSGIKANDFIFPIFMMTEVPHLLNGFLIVAILSAAMSSVSSALTSLASVSTMDFVKPFWPRRARTFFSVQQVFDRRLGGRVIVVAYLSRQVEFVLNAAFSLRGLTSARCWGGSSWLSSGSMAAPAVITGMMSSLAVMSALQVLPGLPDPT